MKLRTISRRTFALLAFPVFTIAQDLRLYEASERHMGTVFKIQLYAPSPEHAHAAFQVAFARIATLDDLLSDYDPSSQLNILVRKAVRKPQRVSDESYAVLRAAQDLAIRTNGAFDVTIGPLTRLWRQARFEQRLPTDEEVASAKARSGYRKLNINRTSTEVALAEREMRLDVGGIAKGYTCDQALKAIGMHLIQSALVTSGRDWVFSEAPPGQKGWKIPIPGGQTLVLVNAAVSTTGDSLEIRGKRYSGILDPSTGKPVSNPKIVTVVTRRGIDADSLATTLAVLGEEQGKEYLPQGASVYIAPWPK